MIMTSCCLRNRGIPAHSKRIILPIGCIRNTAATLKQKKLYFIKLP